MKRIGRDEADALYQAIQQTKIPNPSTNCISPIGEQLLLNGLHHVVPGEFYVAATRPPAVLATQPVCLRNLRELTPRARGRPVWTSRPVA